MNFEKQYGAEHKWHSVACPHCEKLFRVNRADLFPVDYYSFSCLSCQEFFWAALGEGQQVHVWTAKPKKPYGLTLDSAEEIVNDEKICPHCCYTSKVGMAECYQCGLSFSDESWMEKLPYASYSLRKSYEYLLRNFNKKEEHEKFAKQCIKEDNIAFGVKSYGRFLKIHPKNIYSKKMVRYFESISFAQAQPQTPKARSFIEEKMWGYKTGWIHALIVFFLVSCLMLLLIARQILV